MKKILFTLVFVSLVAFSAQAQLKYGVRGGVNLSSLSGDGDEALKNMTGFYIGPSVEVSFLGMAVEGSVLYSQKGIKAEETIEGQTVKADEKIGYIEVPVNLRYKFGLPVVSRLVTPFIEAGPYVAFKVSGDKRIGESNDVSEQWKTKTFGAGLNFGIGVELLSKLQVKGNYSLGLTDNYKAGVGNWSLKDRTWQIGLGYYF